MMAGVVLLGRAMERDGEIYNSPGVAALLILMVWPQSIFSLSFQLSFGATLSIVALHRSLIEFFLLGVEARRQLVGQVDHLAVVCFAGGPDRNRPTDRESVRAATAGAGRQSGHPGRLAG